MKNRFLKNTRLRPLVKININNSLLQGGKEPLRIAYIKKFSVSKAICLESVLKAVQIILRETPVTKSSRKVFKNVNLVRVLPLITNLASFSNNKIFFQIAVGSCAKIFFMFSGLLLSGFLFTVNSKYFFNLSVPFE